MAFLADVGSFFKELGEGVTTTIQGIGANIGSQAELNQAQAAAIMAVAQSTELKLQLEAEDKKRRYNLILYIIAFAAIVPIVGIAIFYGLKK
jgi:hypothetical protein